MILLQNCFFFPEKTFLTENAIRRLSPKGPVPDFLQSPENTFSKYLLAGEEEHCSQFLDELFRYYSCNHTFMPNQIRDLYYQLFNTLSASRKKNQLETELHEKQDLIVDTLNNAFTYEELHKALKEKTAQYFEDAKKFPAGKFHDLYDQGLYQPELYERYTFRKKISAAMYTFPHLMYALFSKVRPDRLSINI